MITLLGQCKLPDSLYDRMKRTIYLVEFNGDLIDKDNTGRMEVLLQNVYNQCCVGTGYDVSVRPASEGRPAGLYKIDKDGVIQLTIDSPHYEAAMAIGRASRRLLSAQKAYDAERESTLWMLDCTLRGIKQSKNR